MNKIKNWIENKLFWIKTGADIRIANDGKPVDELVIRYKDFFFMIDIDAESGEPTGDFGWSQGQPMTPVPIREFYTAKSTAEIHAKCNTGCQSAKCRGDYKDKSNKPKGEYGYKPQHSLKHTNVHPGKRVLVTQYDGTQFTAKFKQKEGRFHHFMDHDKVKSSLIRQLSIVTTDFKED